MKRIKARIFTKEKFKENVCIIVLYSVLMYLTSLISTSTNIGYVANFIISIMFSYTICRIITAYKRDKEMDCSFFIKNLASYALIAIAAIFFVIIYIFGCIYLAYKVQHFDNTGNTIFLLSFSILAVFLLFSVILITYSFAAVPYVSYVYDDLGVIETLIKSNKIMKGNKFDMFVLDLYFIFISFIYGMIYIFIIGIILAIIYGVNGNIYNLPLHSISTFIIDAPFLMFMAFLGAYRNGVVISYVKGIEEDNMNNKYINNKQNDFLIID